MNEALELMVKSGQAKLNALREKQLAEAQAAQEMTARKQAELLDRFCGELQMIIGNELVKHLDPFSYSDLRSGSVMMLLRVDTFPIRFMVSHYNGAHVRLDTYEPFEVAGIRHSAPQIDEDGGLFGPIVDIDFHAGKYVDYPVQSFADIEMALALAAERAKIVRDLRDRYEKQAEELAAAARYAANEEPMYIPADEVGDPTDTLLNLAEWVKLIRGVVAEVLEERGL